MISDVISNKRYFSGIAVLLHFSLGTANRPTAVIQSSPTIHHNVNNPSLGPLDNGQTDRQMERQIYTCTKTICYNPRGPPRGPPSEGT